MSVHSEIQNVLRNRSGDAVIGIHGRSGEIEDGTSFLEMTAGREKTPEEVFLNKGQARARALFLKRYFAVLSSALSVDELRFLKLKIKTKKPDMLIARWCGVSIKKLYENIREKLFNRREEIEDIIDGSKWFNAELFAKMFVRSLKEISQDSAMLDCSPLDTYGDFDELERAREYRALRERIMTIQKERHKIYSRGFEAGRQSERKKKENNKLLRHCNCAIDMVVAVFTWIEGYLSSDEFNIEVLKTFIKSVYPLLEWFRPEVETCPN